MKTMLAPVVHQEMAIEVGRIALRGDLIIPENAKGLVLFAHGSGSSRKSSRNRYVATVLHEHRVGTLLFDLLTLAEEREDAYTAHLRFDIDLLSERLVLVTNLMFEQHGEFAPGYFGASTGAAAALNAAAYFGKKAAAVVSRGGRPDLAGANLPRVNAPTLLIVGSRDFPVIQLNEEAFEKLQCEKKLILVQGATHLFEEPGTLQRAAERAAEWFGAHFK